ncbi:MAG: hypothetical protein ACRDQ1_08825 [Sciscionella sp.]
MFLPESVDVRRSDGAHAVAGSIADPDFSAQRAAGGEFRERGPYRDAVDPVAVRALARDAQDAERVPDENSALIYVIGTSDLQSGPVLRLGEFVTRRGWRLSGVCADADGSAHPCKRPGLATALAGLRSGAASALVLDERTCASLLDGLWMRVAVQQAGGVLCVAADDPADGDVAAASSGLEAVATFVQIVHREDAG